LLYQESQKNNIQLEEAKVSEQIERIKKRFPSESEYKKALQGMKVSEAEIKTRIRQDMIIQEFVDKEIAVNVHVAEGEIRSYYDKNPNFFKQPETVRASHILIKIDPRADNSQKNKARREIEKVQERLKKGEDFATLARQFSEGPSKTKGGDLGFFKRGQMVKPFEEAAFALKPGEVSDIVETQFGYHLIKVFEKKPETVVSYDQSKDRIQQFLKQQKVRKEASSFIKELKKNAVIERF
jgi:peptidyl-prolyl cis-trans isomerase C